MTLLILASMAIEPPPVEHDPDASSEAEALFEEARELERRRRRRWFAAAGGLAAVGIAAVIGFSGGGNHVGTGLAPNHQVGPAASPATSHKAEFTGTIATSGSVCSLASSPATVGDPPPGRCVTQLPNGTRYECPIGLVKRPGALSSIAGNSACHRLRPPTIPANVRPAIRQMNSVKTCLQEAGLTASGAAIPDATAYPGTPIAALLIAGTSRPSTISFYATTAQAKQAYTRASVTVRKQGQQEALKGRVLYDWSADSAAERNAERHCVQVA